MKMKKFIGLMGAVAFTAGIIANLQYAWNDYGVLTNSLHVEVLAQSVSCSDGDGGGTTGGSGGPYYIKETYHCKYEGTAAGKSEIILAPGLTIKVNKDGSWSYTACNADVRCLKGEKELCTPQNCPSYPGLTT